MAVKSAVAPPLRSRRLHFKTMDEVLEEVELLHARPHRQLGNWSLPITAGHLALAIQGSIEGGTFPVPW